MKYSEVGFRGFYHHFVGVPISERIKSLLEGFPGAEEANNLIGYGYYDQSAGITIEVLGAAQIGDDLFRFAPGNSEICSKIRMGNIADDECYYLPDEDGKLAEMYADKLEILKNYDASEDVEKTREMTFLDSCRDEVCIDDVLVYLTKDGLEPEGCWVRINGLGKSWIMGQLLNEPYQNFGWHEGEDIAFFTMKKDDGSIICYTDMNPSMKVTEEDLEDGSMLKNSIIKFKEECNNRNFLDVLEILRDSYIWIPCHAILSEADQARMEAMVAENEGNLDDLVGIEFSNEDDIRLVPDVLVNDDGEPFFPVFSSEEEMGEYGNGFSKIGKHILEAINLAKNNDKNVKGIVVNPFTEQFVLEREIFDIVENMKSRVALSKTDRED